MGFIQFVSDSPVNTSIKSTKIKFSPVKTNDISNEIFVHDQHCFRDLSESRVFLHKKLIYLCIYVQKVLFYWFKRILFHRNHNTGIHTHNTH